MSRAFGAVVAGRLAPTARLSRGDKERLNCGRVDVFRGAHASPRAISGVSPESLRRDTTRHTRGRVRSCARHGHEQVRRKEMTGNSESTVAKDKAGAARLSARKKSIAKARPQEDEQAGRPDAGDERAREREIQDTPKDASGRAWRHGPNVHAPYPGRSPA
jgi:hypothetical protein